MMRSGTGIPTIQPATRTDLRPCRSPRWPASRLDSALASPKEAIKERIAARDAIPNSVSAMSGSTARSSPTIAPTKAFTRTSSENCRQFSLSPSVMLFRADGIIRRPHNGWRPPPDRGDHPPPSPRLHLRPLVAGNWPVLGESPLGDDAQSGPSATRVL